MRRVDYGGIARVARNHKFHVLKELKPNRPRVIDCGYSPAEGCDQCKYQKMCYITEGKP